MAVISSRAIRPSPLAPAQARCVMWGVSLLCLDEFSRASSTQASQDSPRASATPQSSRVDRSRRDRSSRSSGAAGVLPALWILLPFAKDQAGWPKGPARRLRRRCVVRLGHPTCRLRQEAASAGHVRRGNHRGVGPGGSCASAWSKFRDKNAIAALYGLPDGEVLRSWIRAFNFIRNVAAHHARLWNRINTEIPTLPPLERCRWLEPLHRDPASLRKLFGALTCMRFMLRTIAPHSRWHLQLKEHIATFPKSDLLSMRAAGFPDAWQELLVWK
jgi:hypothetical protein